MNPMRKLLALTALVSLTACVQRPYDPNLAAGVQRQAVNLYSVSELDNMGRDLISVAVSQCQIHGQSPDVVTSTTKTGFYSDRVYPVIIFKCK